MKRKFHFLTIIIVVLFIVNFTSYPHFDFGDSPDPLYSTLIANNGANHLVRKLFTGQRIKGKIDGQPNNYSKDDTIRTTDDRDDIMFSTWLVPGQNAIIVIYSSISGFLDGWIDFQGNGNWSDPGDQIFTGQPLIVGKNTFIFSIPPGAGSGFKSFGRFRTGAMGGSLPIGNAPGGEVDDYQVILGLPNIDDTVVDIDAALSYTQNEISMTLIPGTGTLIAAYNDSPYPGGPGIGLSYSTDQGQTWNSSQLTIPYNSISGVDMVDTFDPSIDRDDSGHVFVAHIATDFNWSNGPISGLFVHKSIDEGTSWGTPVTVDTEPSPTASPDPNYRYNDRCQIRVDKNPSSPYYNNIYVTWTKDRGWNMLQPYSDVYISVSTDGGNVYSTAFQINASGNSMGNMPIHEIAANGDLYVLWMDYNKIRGGEGLLLLDKSTDGGITWGRDMVVDTISLPPINLNEGTDVLAKGAAVLRVHPTNSSKLYIVYAADPDGIGIDESDIFFIKSMDGGISWSDPLKLNNDETTNDQILPWMEVTPSGIIDVVWYDRRNDPSDLFWDVYATASIDGGNSFPTNMKLNATSFVSPQTKSGAWFGEYLGLVASDNTAFVCYSSTAIDLQGDIFFASYNNPPIIIGFDDGENNVLNVKIYPNPTGTEVYIDMDYYEEIIIELYDNIGNLILSKESVVLPDRIDMSGFEQGIYLIRVSTEGMSVTKSIVKN